MSGRSCTPGGRSWDLLRLQQKPCRAVEPRTEVCKTLVVYARRLLKAAVLGFRVVFCLQLPHSGRQMRMYTLPVASNLQKSADGEGWSLKISCVFMRRFVFIPLPASDFALLPCFFFVCLLLPYVVYLHFHLIYPSGWLQLPIQLWFRAIIVL